ncbi:MAG: BatD family protein [Flavobacteriaceae bacterium]
MFRLRLFMALLMVSLLGFSQEEQTQFEVVLSKNRLGLNERLRVSFEMNKDGDLFEPPAFSDFEVLMGPSQSTSSSWINGKRSFSRSYTYVLKPKRQGTLSIKPAYITIGGERYATEEKQVEVSAAVANPNAPKTAQDVANESLYLVASISKPSPYENEAVLVTYTLYFSPQVYINNFVPVDNPSYNNFWSQDIPINEYETRKTTYKNELFNAVDLKQVVLYPQKSGELPIEPFSLELYVQIPTGRRDFFGDPIMRSATKVVSAGSSVLNVKALPTADRPENFSGAVGSFNFETSANKTTLDANESLQIQVKVSGEGNLKLLKLPELNLPSSLEQYEPEFNDEVTVSAVGMRGAVSQTYTVVPRYVGNYPINTLNFTYFDPEKERYVSLSSAPFSISVENGPVRSNTNASSPSEAVTNVPSTLSVQNAFVSNAFTSAFEPIDSESWAGNLVHLALVLSFILIALLIGLSTRLYQKTRLNGSGSLKRSYQKRLKLLLRETEEAASKGQNELFYESLSKTLDQALSLLIKDSIRGSSESQIKRMLEPIALEPSIVQEIADLINKVNLIRYSPASSSDIKTDIERLNKLIQLIQSKAKAS